MPIYEYQCEQCQQRFEIITRKSSDTAECPTCQGSGRKVVSTFSAGSSSPAGCGSMGGPGCGSAGGSGFG